MRLFYGYDMFDLPYMPFVGNRGTNLIISSPPTIYLEEHPDDFFDLILWLLDDRGLFLLDTPYSYQDLIGETTAKRDDIHWTGMIHVWDQYDARHQAFFALTPQRDRKQINLRLRGNSAPRGHRREFDPDVIAELISTFTKPKDVVLDFCCGTATVPITADRLGRLGIGVDRRDVRRIIA